MRQNLADGPSREAKRKSTSPKSNMEAQIESSIQSMKQVSS